MARAILLYDADCGFCTRAAGAAQRLRLDLVVQPIVPGRLAGLGVDVERAARELPFVAADGSVSYGHRAVAHALGTGPLPARVIGRALDARIWRRPAAAAYGWVARHRHELPGGTSSCALPSAGAAIAPSAAPAAPTGR